MDPIESTDESEQLAACYRHPDRQTGVSCQRCGRAICTSCMHQASVGVHCPECVTGTTQRVYTPRTVPGAAGTVTRVLVGINAAVFVLAVATGVSTVGSAGGLFGDYGTWGPGIVDGEWWRLVTGGFLHSGFIHIGFNMYLLWQLGRQMERVLGELDFFAVYMTCLLGGSFGAMLLSPSSAHGGASGAVFGLFGATALLYRSRGIGLFDTGLGMLIGLNLLFTFGIPGVSVGGHIGGFLTGIAIGAVYFGFNPGQPSPLAKNRWAPLGVTAAVAVVLFIAGLVAAGG